MAWVESEKKGIKLTILFYAPHYSVINFQIFIQILSLLIVTGMKNKLNNDRIYHIH